MSYARIEIGGPASLKLLGVLFDKVRDYDVWIPLQPEMKKNVRGDTFLGILGKKRMLGDLLNGSHDEDLEPCSLHDWLIYCVWVSQEEKALQLEADDCRFSDDSFSDELQVLKVDYRIELPGDEANQCEPLIIRPGKKHARSIYASSFCIHEPRYSRSEVEDFLDDREKTLEILEHDNKEVEALKII